MLVDRLQRVNVDVTCLVRPESRSEAPLQVGGQPVRILEVPSFEPEALRSKLADTSAEVIFHLASYGVQEGARDIDQLVEGNVTILLNLLQATEHWPLRRFIHTGSCSEYGGPIAEGSLIAETHPLRPKSLYGAAKAASFLCGTALASSLGVPFVTLRLFGVYGTREGPRRLIPYLISRLQDNQPVDLTPGEQVRDLLFENDVADAFVAAATADGLKSGEAYNVCSSRPLRIREIGGMVASTMEKSHDLLRWGDRAYREDEPMWLVGDNRRFCEATDWQPKISISEGIQCMVEHARERCRRSERKHAVR